MSYYDQAMMMALKLGPWANRTPTEIDRDIEQATMMRQRLTPERPAIGGAVKRMLVRFARGWSRRSRRRPRSNQELGPLITRCRADRAVTDGMAVTVQTDPAERDSHCADGDEAGKT
ncbi:hypothetical protein [Hoeflea sp.]|uniref:hypothetical protein n=1 Tax=Hoeflea sp. TaxID=1940281 RepID=UPI001986FFE1|nr:hypothetical protein [Hoeflea sp.]MBC7282439.1 hypothetical protein [Hoeflea sp.]